MIRTHQKCPDTDRGRQSHWWVFQPIEMCLRFIEKQQLRLHEIFIKRVSEEKAELLKSQSKTVTVQRHEINEEDLIPPKREKEVSMRGNVF
jgi:hypothetical protein